MKNYFKKKKQINKGISMLSLVITVVVIIILALVAFAASTRMVDEANYSTYSNNFSEVETFFEKTSVNMHGSDLLKDAPKRDEQIYNYVAKGGSGEADFLSVNALPAYTVIKENADIGIDIPVTKVESGTGHMIPIKYATTKEGQIFTWPPYEYGDELYITKVDTVGHKMQTEITVGGEKVQIKIDPTDGSLVDADVEQKPLPNNPVVPEEPETPEDGVDEEHDFSGKIQSDEYLASAATCVSPARYYYKCLQCSVKSTETYTVGGGLGHIYGDWKTNGTATCISTAEKTKTCTRCGDTQRETIDKNPDNHTGGETTTTVAATCTKEGSKIYKCASCGVQKRKETIAKDPSNHGTNEQKEVVVDATCTIAGSKTYTCSGCSVEISAETIAALNHVWSGYTVTTPATCTTTGVKTRTCSRCGSVETATIQKDSSNHHNGDVNTSTTDATCTVAGKTEKTCTLCGGTLSSETIAALGHIDENKDSKCDRCGITMTYAANTLVFKADGVAYLYGENGTVTKTYTGWMTGSYSYGTTPWRSQSNNIETIIFEDGVSPSDTEEWFYNNNSIYQKLTTVIIGNDVKKLGINMFYNCKALKTLTIGTGVAEIGGSAFRGCRGLEKIYFNATAMNDLDSDGNFAFGYVGYDGSGIEMIVGKNVTKIPGYLFYSYWGDNINATIKKVTFESGSVCKSIGARAFGDITTFTSMGPTGSGADFELPSSLQSIGNQAFLSCSGLTTLTIPSSLRTIGNQTFQGTGITKVTIPSTVTSIGSSAFAACQSLTTATINTKSIGNSAFVNCQSLTSVTIGSGLTTISQQAFSSDAKLTKITIPSTVKTISKEAFYSCETLSTINFSGTTSQWNSISKGSSWRSFNPACTVVCTDGTVSLKAVSWS